MPKKKKLKAGLPSGEFLVRPPKDQFIPRPSDKGFYESQRTQAREGKIKSYDLGTYEKTAQSDVRKAAVAKGEREYEYGRTKVFIDDNIRSRFKGQARGLPGAKKAGKKLAGLWLK